MIPMSAATAVSMKASGEGSVVRGSAAVLTPGSRPARPQPESAHDRYLRWWRVLRWSAEVRPVGLVKSRIGVDFMDSGIACEQESAW